MDQIGMSADFRVADDDMTAQERDDWYEALRMRAIAIKQAAVALVTLFGEHTPDSLPPYPSEAVERALEAFQRIEP
jgi:hypothetical protein